MLTTRLESLRQEIDSLDHQLLEILAKRFAVVQQIGVLKKQHQLAALDQQRWQVLLQERLVFARTLQLQPGFIAQLFKLIHDYALAIQHNL